MVSRLEPTVPRRTYCRMKAASQTYTAIIFRPRWNSFPVHASMLVNSGDGQQSWISKHEFCPQAAENTENKDQSQSLQQYEQTSSSIIRVSYQIKPNQTNLNNILP
jgi:NADH pyrophosphatase NudC (nudix superfamily)